MKCIRRISIVGTLAAILSIAACHRALADGPSTGTDGINSAGLGVTGKGIAIGQVEGRRPGLPGFDDAAHSHPNVTPAGVFLRDGAAVANTNTGNHAQQVAGVMIGSHAAHRGVAPGASLYSSAMMGVVGGAQQRAALSAQHVAGQNGGDVRAVNMSFGTPAGAQPLDGSSLFTQFVDWSAGKHDTLYVVAGNQGDGGFPIPTDHFNGVTVARTQQIGVVFRQVDPRNLFTEDAVGDRRSVDLLAPGRNIVSTNLGGTFSNDTFTDANGSGDWDWEWMDNDGTGAGAGDFQADESWIELGPADGAGGYNNQYDAATDLFFDDDGDRTRNGAADADYYIGPGDTRFTVHSEAVQDVGGDGIVDFPVVGTSFAAPHVTGTVALLQEFGDAQIKAGTPHWGADADARRHQVTKAVLMNSVDKVEDTGDGRLLGMEKKILDTNGRTWLQSDAATSKLIPLDDQMGTGQLNAKRALQQFTPGEWDSFGSAEVPLIGWDWGWTLGADDVNEYIFDTPLLKDSYVSVTLAWDREIQLNESVTTNGLFDAGETFTPLGLTDLDLYLLPKDATDVSQNVWASYSLVDSVEHIFFKIPEEGEYKFWVRQFDEPLGDQSYGVAWWAVPVPEPGSIIVWSLLATAAAGCGLRRRRR